MTTAAIIVAAGRGARAGGGLPKQWRPLAGRRVIDWTLARIRAAASVDRIVLVVQDADAAHWQGLAAPDVSFAPGGADRAGSVRNGLAALAGQDVTKVLIHDAARACVSPELIDAVAAALDHAPAVAPGLPVTDALWTVADDTVTGVQDRSGLPL